MAKISISDEFKRICVMLSGLTVSFPIMLMTRERIDQIERDSANDAMLATLNKELGKKLKAVTQPEDHVEMGQAYEAYVEAVFYIEMKRRGTLLARTPGTGRHGAKRPDFTYTHENGGHLYFEVKALEIVDPTFRHPDFAKEGLEKAVDLSERAQVQGTHFSEQELSGHLPTDTAPERIDKTIRKIRNNVKCGQINFGPTILVVDMGRLNSVPQGPSGLLPVFFHDGPPAESCVSGELWQIALGQSGEQIFELPEFDGASNLAGHQEELGILRKFPKLVGIMFMLPRWSEPPELLTVWNNSWSQGTLQNPCRLTEHEIEKILDAASDGLNDARNETGWPYRVTPLRRKH